MIVVNCFLVWCMMNFGESFRIIMLDLCDVVFELFFGVLCIWEKM